MESKNCKVLVIDNEPSIAEWLKIILEREGYAVRTAGTSNQGEELVRAWQPDVVTTDLSHPGLSGLEYIGLLSTLRPEAKIIVLTGGWTFKKGIQARLSGAFTVLQKPAEACEVLDAIRMAIAL